VLLYKAHFKTHFHIPWLCSVKSKTKLTSPKESCYTLELSLHVIPRTNKTSMPLTYVTYSHFFRQEMFWISKKVTEDFITRHITISIAKVVKK